MANVIDDSIPVLTDRVPAERAVRFRPVRWNPGAGGVAATGTSGPLEALLTALAGTRAPGVPLQPRRAGARPRVAKSACPAGAGVAAGR